MILIYSSKAKKELRRISPADRKKVLRKITLLVDKPLLGKKLSGELLGMYSLKAWPYRVKYELMGDTVWIKSIVHRQGAYK